MDKVAEAYVQVIGSINYDKIAGGILKMMPCEDRDVVAAGMIPKQWIDLAGKMFEESIRDRYLTGVTPKEFQIELSKSLIKGLHGKKQSHGEPWLFLLWV